MNLDINEIIAVGARPEGLSVLSFYAPQADFNKEYGELFRLILSQVSFDRTQIQAAYRDSRAGFFTGLWQGAIWIFRWIFSWVEYDDVWPDRNTGFGYVCGFVLGLLLAVVAGGSSRGRYS
ncbi:MAG: hypothetical protein ACE5HI_10950 [bacterium]